ncbi:uncharacterized protein LOC130649210 isoform X2 [Hydractinia symbiolongicarpus]|uniref:uncharacterized protein LOC130649210 isoform X2 n=1 Tax=Hydractinia symbiolongicarpus TaxID=13093 RepID=UPI00254A3D53|nr:uncharacterized protein LOC130649210 isoform X2 [Hydractinia symbiolongicarpus]
MMTIGVKFLVCVLIGRPVGILGDVQIDFNYPNGYSSYSDNKGIKSSGYTSRLQCALMCYDEKIKKSFQINSCTFREDGYCWCGSTRLRSFSPDLQYQTNVYNFIPVYTSLSTIKSNARPGGNLRIFVSTFLQKRGNDKIIYFAFEDMNVPYNASRSVRFKYATSTEIKHPATKQTYKISEEIGETNVEMLNPHYYSDVQIVDNDNHNSNSFWIATIRENNAMVIVDTSVQYNISRPSYSCLVSAEASNGEFDVDSEDFVVDIELTTTRGCNKNVEDVSISLYNEVYLEPYEVDTQHTNTCIPETSLDIQSTHIHVKYWRLFMYSQICIRVRYRHSGVNMGGEGSKRTTVLADIFYTGFRNNLSMTYSIHQEYKTSISKNVKGFLLFKANYALCASYNNGHGMMSMRNDRCTIFKHIPYNLMASSGSCSYKIRSGLLGKQECNHQKRLSGETTALRWLDGGTYVKIAGSKGDKVKSTYVQVPFARQYTKSFGLKHNVKKVIDKKTQIDDVSLLWNGHEFFVCNYVNNRFYRCIIYKKEIYRVTPLPPLFASVLGYDKKRRITIGFSKERRYVGFRSKDKYKSFYLSPNYWSKLEGAGNLVLAKSYNRSLLNVSKTEEKFEVGSDVYTVTPLGLYHDAEQQHIIVWLDHQKC